MNQIYLVLFILMFMFIGLDINLDMDLLSNGLDENEEFEDEEDKYEKGWYE